MLSFVQAAAGESIDQISATFQLPSVSDWILQSLSKRLTCIPAGEFTVTHRMLLKPLFAAFRWNLWFQLLDLRMNHISLEMSDLVYGIL
jgi:hypothetical protein